MIRSVTITNSLGESINLELTNPWKNGIAVKSITGLGSPLYTVNTTPYASGDGSVMGSINASTRNIVFELYPLFNPQVEDSRQLLYRYFQFKKPITMSFELDYRKVSIVGYVEDNTPDIFSNRETIQISVICPNPNFEEDETYDQFFYGEVPMFEFPFSNESLDEYLLVTSELIQDNRATIEYTAEIDAGVLIVIDCYNAPGDITLYNIQTLGKIYISDEKIQRFTGAKLRDGDQILISTYSGKKYTRLLREGVYHDIIGAINKDIDWFTLQQGPNSFTYTTGEKDASIIVSFRYHNTYGAI